MPTVIHIQQDVLSQEVSGETVLLNLNNESYFGLDPVGTRIWQLIKEHGDRQKIINTLLHEFDVTEEQLTKDVDQLLTRMTEAGLVDIHKD